jgi:hypothetical protein
MEYNQVLKQSPEKEQRMPKSKYEKYLVRKPLYERLAGIKNRQSPVMTYMSRALVPEATCYLSYGWIYGMPEPNPHVKEHTHDAAEIILYFGSDPQNPEDLGGEIEFWVGGQPLTFSTAAALYLPAGLRHGPIIWRKYKRPHAEMMIMPGNGTLGEDRANALAGGAGSEGSWKRGAIDYEHYLVRKPIYERGRGVKNRQSPTMTFMSSAQIPEADYYIEFGWIYGIPDPNPPVTRHVHKHDELILHFGGDPQNPEDLGGEIEVSVEDEPMPFNTNTALFAPKGLTHCPVTWKKVTKPHIEMAITLGFGTR